MSLRQLKNSRCCTNYMLKNSSSWCIRLQQSYRQHMLSMIINSTQNCSSSRRSQFDCMLSIMRYQSKLSMKQLLPGNTRYCKKHTLKHYYNSHTMLILLNKQCKLWLKPDSTLNYSSSRRSPFNCMLSIMRYQSKLSMTSLSPSSIPNYSSNMRHRFSCMLSIMKYQNKLDMKSLSPGNTRYCIVRKAKNYYKVNTMLILLNKQCKLWLKPDSSQNYSSSRRLQFGYMLNITKYSNKLNMRLLTPSKSHLRMKYKLLRSDYRCCSL